MRARIGALSLGATLILAPALLGAQRALPDSAAARPGTRVRVRVDGEHGWHVGRLAPSGPDTVRLLACPSCTPSDYPARRVRALEWSDGHRRNVVFVTTILGMFGGTIGGAYAGVKLDRCVPEFCKLDGLVFGAATGLLLGTTGGVLLGHRIGGERWHPAALPGRAP